MAKAKRKVTKKATKKKAVKKSKPARTTKKKSIRVKGKMSGLDAAAKILAASGEPLTCNQIVDIARNKKYWLPEGKTPANTLYSALLRELKKGKASRFKKVGRGLFALVK